MHYRAPTEKGSSGSPIFNASPWQVVALHHAGGRPEEWPANEGIWIPSITDFVPTCKMKLRFKLSERCLKKALVFSASSAKRIQSNMKFGTAILGSDLLLAVCE